ILSFSEWTNPFVAFSLFGLKLPLFLSDRMSPLAKLPFISEFLRGIYYKKATGIIAQSNFAKEVLKKKTNATNISVIYNPVNVIPRIDCTPKKRIVSVGRLEEVKGHKFLIQAFAKVNNLDWELSIVGDGSLKAELENLTKELGVSDRVIFHGHLSDFGLQLSEAEIFVLPSLSEGFPNALIEAMSLPMACIASDTFNGFNEIVENGINGVLVKPGNISELTSAIKMLIDDKTMRVLLKENAIKVRENLNFEKIAQSYLDIIMPNK
ncbi:MAG: glycosyltransferase, partial [Bacteroidota bacterium]|nr:glycosyltransferase [Bacteroidota bacterium]